jgi:hypothetical protein
MPPAQQAPAQPAPAQRSLISGGSARVSSAPRQESERHCVRL